MQKLQMEEIFVSRLYGLYNHRIELKSGGLTIIHGANGVGKTAVLRCIKYLFDWDIEALSAIPFRYINIALSDGSKISVARTSRVDKAGGANFSSASGPLEISFFKDSKTHIETVHAIDPEILNFAESMTKSQPWLVKVRSGLWLDERSNKKVDVWEVVQDYIPARKKKKSYSEFFDKIRKSLSVKMVDTFRLNIKSNDKRPDFSVSECASDMTRRLKAINAEYAKRAQELDQHFPHRLIMNDHQFLPPKDVKRKLAALEWRQAELSKIGILASFSGPQFPSDVDSLPPEKLETISLFVQDSERKLDTFNDLAIRCSALLKLINEKFKHKQLMINRDEGLIAIDSFGHPIPITALSSGEQHELVITYELLFRTPSNTLLLIDEPEISLHVAWQKSFINDLLYISQIVGFESIVATHSPFIVGDNFELMVILDDGEHGE